MKNLPSVDLVDIAAHREPVLAEAGSLVIRSQADYAAAGGLTLALRQLRDYIVSRFKPSKDALNVAKRELLALEQDQLAPVLEAQGEVDRKLLVWAQAQERRQERSREAGNDPEDKVKLEGITYRDGWSFSITDEPALKAALWKVHPELLVVDKVALGKLVRAAGDTLKLPGLAVARTKTVVGHAAASA